MAVNLSTRQFLHNDLVSQIRDALLDTGCKPEWLKLEITESLLLEDSPAVLNILQQLHQMGLCISIDDFGTGYSALSYLHRFPVGELKIDKSFIQDININQERGYIVQAIVSLAKNLRKTVVAEGVETLEQIVFLKEIGCSLAQGYWYGKPVPLAIFDSHLKKEAIYSPSISLGHDEQDARQGTRIQIK